VIGERAAAQGRQSRSGDRREDRVIGDDSGDANGSKTAWCAQRRDGAAARWLSAVRSTDGGGAHGGDPQSGCGDDGAEKPVTPDP
jgi:hypothetical protein